jgi:hypothetical protein
MYLLLVGLVAMALPSLAQGQRPATRSCADGFYDFRSKYVACFDNSFQYEDGGAVVKALEELLGPSASCAACPPCMRCVNNTIAVRRGYWTFPAGEKMPAPIDEGGAAI